MTKAAKIIERLGGTVAVARALDLPPSTVSSWKGSKIPKWRMSGVLAFAQQQNIDLNVVPDTAPASTPSPGIPADLTAAQQSEAA